MEKVEIYARYIEKTDSYQLLDDHLLCVGQTAASFAKKIGYEEFGLLSGLLHDLGKYSCSWQTYLLKSVRSKGLIEKEDHATAGAQYVNKVFPEFYHSDNPKDRVLLQAAMELLEMIIMYHHGQGLPDMVSPDGTSHFLLRIGKSHDDTCIDEIVKSIPEFIKDSIRSNLTKYNLSNTFSHLFSKITEHVENTFLKKNQWMFELGLFARFQSSCLIDADRLNSAFTDNWDEKNQALKATINWDELLTKLENHLSCFQNDSKLNNIRQEISERSKSFAGKTNDVYTLSAATGSGKTLASLRYALTYAARNNSSKVFIIAPYTSILEQNAGVIKQILEDIADTNIVLECHSNIVIEEDDSEYSLLSERWDSPIICTTMVQFLESIFSSGTKKIRRMHQLANAVIIFDEIQTLPLKCTCLFNWLIPFLKHICNSTILLCTATQPALNLFEGDLVPFRLNLCKNNEIIPDVDKHYHDLKRVDVIDKTTTTGLSLDEVASFIIEELVNTSNSILIVVNTKPQAALLFSSLKSFTSEESLYHLSTNMCPAHRKKAIEEIKYKLKEGEKIVCISTRLIEAGVDIDFSCAIRFLAGLDSIAQTAGRCNRNGLLNDKNGKPINGKTFIVNIAGENLGSLDEIKHAQSITKRVLSEYHADEKKYSFSILHPDLMTRYFKYFYSSEDIGKLTYSFLDNKYGKQNVIDLLSMNTEGSANFQQEHKEEAAPFFRQAFQTAWKRFEVIEQNTIGVIVPYGKGTELIGQFASIEYEDFSFLNKLLREAQLYSVTMYQNQLLYYKEQISVIKLPNDCTVYYVNDGYYSPETGLSKDFSGCSVMNY